MRSLVVAGLLSFGLLFLTGCSVHTIPSAPQTPVSTGAPPPISSIQIQGLETLTFTSGSAQLSIAATTTSGTSEAVPNSEVAWTVTGPGAISATGLFWCTGNGSLTLEAQIGSISSTATTTCVDTPLAPPWSFIDNSSEFAGPFASWLNIKSQFGAKGDGVSDDSSAFQAALAAIQKEGATLWIPAGRYIISTPLSLSNCTGFTIVGEDPSKTTIRWNGVAGATMLTADGCNAFRISRLTFDGNNSADTAERIWWTHNPGTQTTAGHYPTFDQISDQIITNVNVGIRIGFAGETTVERVHFDHNVAAGISQEDPDALNFWVRDSVFTNCGTGVTNALASGAGDGAFQVMSSVFSGSMVADMSIGNTGDFSIRHNISINSKAFFTATNSNNPANVIIQANTIAYPGTTPIQISNLGPLTLLDNTFIGMDDTVPLVAAGSEVPLTILSAGNSFTANRPFAGHLGQVISIDEAATTGSAVQLPPVPSSVYIPPAMQAPVFDVVSGSRAAQIQNVINTASSVSGLAIVHFPRGYFNIDQTLVIPAASNIVMAGDGPMISFLDPTQGSSGSILNVLSPTFELTNIYLGQTSGGATASGIQVQIPDRPENQVICDQCNIKGNLNAMLSDGMDQVDIESLSGQFGAAAPDQEGPAVEVVGGPLHAAGGAAFGRVDLFDSSSDPYNVDDGGELMIQDGFHDSGQKSIQFHLSGRGSITHQGGVIGSINSIPSMVVDGFHGDVSVIGIGASVPLQITGASNSANVLMVGSVMSSPNVAVQAVDPPASLLAVDNFNNESGIYAVFPSQGDESAGWMQHMMAQARVEYPSNRNSIGNGAGRMLLDRVLIEGLVIGLHVLPVPASSGNGYTLISRNNTVLDASSSGQCVSEVNSNGGSWQVTKAADGGFVLHSTQGFLAEPVSSAASQVQVAGSGTDVHGEWLVRSSGDGYFFFVNRADGRYLTSEGTGGCAAVFPESGNASQEWSIVSASN